MQIGSESAQVELACLEVRGQIYGIDVQQVREIVRAQTLTPLPRAPELVEGVIDLRGVIVPVVDLGRALGGAPIADAAAEVLAVPGSSVQSPPALVAQSGYDAIRAVVRRPDLPPVLVLALESVLETVYRSKLREIPKEAA